MHTEIKESCRFCQRSLVIVVQDTKEICKRCGACACIFCRKMIVKSSAKPSNQEIVARRLRGGKIDPDDYR